MADYERAASLDPALAEVDYARGRMLLDAGWLQSAELILSRFVEKRPDQVKAHDTLAQVLEQRGRHDRAAVEFGKAIRLSTAPAPELYIARARALAGIGDARVPEAIRGLDEGIKRLGPIVTLQSLAIELDLRRGQYDAALARVQTLMDQSQRKERWLIQRGDILRHAGRPTEARRAFHEALEAIDRLTPARRSTAAVVELQKHAKSALKNLDAGAATRPAERGK